MEVSTGEVEAVEGLRSLDSVIAETAPDTSGLEDIGVASFGPTAESIIQTDDRVQIHNTSAYPWRAHASLLITAADGSSWIGTGWFISPRTLITAGDRVFIKNSGVPGRDGWVRSSRVMPGRNGSTLPYGSSTSTSFRSVTGWTGSGNHNYDYGAIILPTTLGSTVGWFGRHHGRAERQRRLSPQGRQPLRRRGACLRRGDSELGNARQPGGVR